MASKTVGIQQLLGTEKKAADMVAEARKRKNKRLKQAKDEAAVEVEAYRKEREGEFGEYEETHLGSKADIAARIDADTVAQLKAMDENVASHKEEVLEDLMKMISEIKVEVHKNLQ